MKFYEKSGKTWSAAILASTWQQNGEKLVGRISINNNVPVNFSLDVLDAEEGVIGEVEMPWAQVHEEEYVSMYHCIQVLMLDHIRKNPAQKAEQNVDMTAFEREIAFSPFDNIPSYSY